MQSVSEENYIKALYHLQDGETLVSTNDIAGKMNTKASSVTDMLKKLAEKSLIDYVPYKGSKLTQNGRSCAMQIIRKHRLWELFLVEKLNFSWDEVHEVAEQLEHIQSRKLIDEIDKLLNRPKYDPHGDPIPDETGTIIENTYNTLAELKTGDAAKLSAVTDSSAIFLQYLDRNKLEIGSVLNVVYREELDGSCTVSTEHGKLYLSQMVASKLLVIPNTSSESNT